MTIGKPEVVATLCARGATPARGTQHIACPEFASDVIPTPYIRRLSTSPGCPQISVLGRDATLQRPLLRAFRCKKLQRQIEARPVKPLKLAIAEIVSESQVFAVGALSLCRQNVRLV